MVSWERQDGRKQRSGTLNGKQIRVFEPYQHKVTFIWLPSLPMGLRYRLHGLPIGSPTC